MGKRRNIYDDDPMYNWVHLQTNFYIKNSFKRLIAIGKENVPDDGVIIFAPNHCNTLMDPLAILGTYPGKIVFVARADIFKTKFAGVLDFLRIMPINRRRDGIRSVIQVDETITKAIEVLKHDTPFCILPEGTHRTMHSLMSIGKGIARIAVGAVEVCDKPVYIVPVGLEYGDYFRYRSTLVVHYGEAINVNELIDDMKDCSQLDVYNEIRKVVGDRIKENIVYIPDDQDYEAMRELSLVWSSRIPELDPVGRFKANRDAAQKLVNLRAENPQKAEALFSRGLEYRKKRIDAGVSMHVAGIKNILFETVLRSLMLLLFTPLAFAWAVASLPGWGLAEYVCKVGKDAAFNNSVRCAVLDFVWTFFLIVWAVVLFVVFKPLLALVILVLLIPAPFGVYDYVEAARRTLSCWRLLFRKDLRDENEELFNEMTKI